jgi:hypothetical protein
MSLMGIGSDCRQVIKRPVPLAAGISHLKTKSIS